MFHYAFFRLGVDYEKLFYSERLSSLGSRHNRQRGVVSSAIWSSLRSRRKIPQRSITTRSDQRRVPPSRIRRCAIPPIAGAIQFSSDGGVANGTSNLAATPAGDATNYLWGVNGLNALGFNGAEVIFNPANGAAGLPNSFNIYWGSIDALMTNPDGSPRYDNTLTCALPRQTPWTALPAHNWRPP